MEAGWKLVVPEEFKERVIREAHCTPVNGNLGIEKTAERVGREYYWKGYYHDVADYVRSCDLCQRYKISQHAEAGLMERRIVEEPWAEVSEDLMEFPQSKSRNKFLIVIEDLFIRWIEVKPVPRATGAAVQKALEKLVIFRWGTPRRFIVVNGSELDNNRIAELVKCYGIEFVATPPYHHRANPTERCNRTLKPMIAMFVEKDQRECDVHIHEFRNAVNTAVHALTRVLPAYLNFGRHPLPVASLKKDVEKGQQLKPTTIDEWKARLARLEHVRDLVRKHNEKAQERQAKAFDKGKREEMFVVGREVWRKTHFLSNAAKGISEKLCAKFEGPYKILEVLSPTVGFGREKQAAAISTCQSVEEVRAPRQAMGRVLRSHTRKRQQQGK